MESNPVEEKWFAEQRAIVEEYLKRQEVKHRGVARFPSFHLWPHIALWAVQSSSVPGTAAWWAISGDVPTDYIPREVEALPREALRQFSERWRDIANHMRRGVPHPKISFGPKEKWPELEPLLRARGDALLFLVADQEMWTRWSAVE